MQLLEQVWKRPLAAAAAAGCLLGALIGLLWPLPAPIALKGDDGPLPLPARAALQRYSEADFALLRDGRLWTGSATAQAGSAKVRSWRLLGVVIRPSGAALVEADRKQARVTLGQALPDGALLRSVSADGIEFERNNCLFKRPLYSLEDIPITSPDCQLPRNAKPPIRSTPSA